MHIIDAFHVVWGQVQLFLRVPRLLISSIIILETLLLRALILGVLMVQVLILRVLVSIVSMLWNALECTCNFFKT